MSILRIILLLFRALFRDRSQLALENLALRQQVVILRHKAPRPRLRRADRAFWVSLARVWDQWRSILIIVRPETVLRWHRQGFRYFWRWKSRGRPCVSPELIRLIRQMSQENPLWGAPRIHSELLLLGYDVAEATVAKYMTQRGRRPPSQSWRTFLQNHLRCTAACDFFVVPTATFRLLFCFVVLSHDRRRIVHFKNHLRQILRGYVLYYNASRPHLSLRRNAPMPRSVEPSALGAVVAVPQVGGLHHRYTRAA